MDPNPKAKEEQSAPSPVHDVSMGESLTAAPSYSQQDSADMSGQIPYPRAGSSLGGQSPDMASFEPAKNDSIFSQSVISTELVKFTKKVPAMLQFNNERADKVRIWEISPCICIDPAAQHLLWCFGVKMQETIKWRINWDKDPKEQEQRAAKGQQRAGPGNGEEWNIVSAFGPPEYKPNNTNREIDIMIAEVVDFAYHSCNVPESFWKNYSQQGIDAKKKDNVYCPDDMRQLLLLKVIRALHGKPRCSFINPSQSCEKEDDVYYFPDGAAFCDAHKPSGFMAACVLFWKPDAKMHEVTRDKGKDYILLGKALQDKPMDRGKPSVPKIKALTASASTSASSAMLVVKKTTDAAETKDDVQEMD